MKNAIRLLAGGLVCLLFTSVMSQHQTATGTIDLYLTVKDNQGQALANTPVEFVETHQRTLVTGTTDAQGQLHHTFDQGRFWQINILEVRDYFAWEFEVVPERSYRMDRTVTYDPVRFRRETRPPVDRSTLSFTTIAQRHPASPRADQDQGVVQLVLRRPNKQALGNFPVQLTCLDQQTTYTTKTNTRGEAFFLVPKGQDYEVDLDGIPGYAYADLPDRPGQRITRRLTYEPTVVHETQSGDTITQHLPASQKGTTGRVLVNLTLTGGPGGTWPGEPIYVQTMGEPALYRVQTDPKGQATLLLPKGKRYMVHGRFQKNLDHLDFRRRRGIGYATKTVRYTPLPKYQYPERYIPQPDNLLLTEFRQFLTRQYPKPEARQAIRLLGQFTGVLHPEAREAVLRLALTTPAKGDLSHAPPLNIALVVDRSGSMAGEDRIDELKKSLLAFVRLMRPDDILSLVSFSDFETVEIAACKRDQERFAIHLERMEAGGGTDILKGMLAGYQQVQKHHRNGRISRLVLLSDGYGIHPPEELVQAQKPYSDRGIACSTVGVGEDYNYALLKLLADHGGGHIQHVPLATDLREAFLEELASLLFPVAKDVQVTVQYPSGLAFRQLYGYPVADKGGQLLRLRLDNSFAGVDQLAFIRFRLDQPSPEKLAQPVRVRIRYTDVATGKTVDETQEIPLEWTEARGEYDLVRDQEEKKLYSVAVLNQSLKVMADKFHSGDRAGAKAALEDGLLQLKAIHPGATDEDLNRLRQQLEQYLDVVKKQLVCR